MEALHSRVVLLQKTLLFLHLKSSYVFCRKISFNLRSYISYTGGSFRTARPSLNTDMYGELDYDPGYTNFYRIHNMYRVSSAYRVCYSAQRNEIGFFAEASSNVECLFVPWKYHQNGISIENFHDKHRFVVSEFY